MGCFLKKSVVVALAICAGVVFARPASMAVQTVQNKDGSSVSIRHFGDEHYHFTETADGYLVTGDGEGNYVYVDASGKPSSVVAKNAVDRSDADVKFLEGLDQEAVRKNHKNLNGGRFPAPEETSGQLNFSHLPLMAFNQDGAPARMARPKPKSWVTGERWIPVLLVGTTDKAYGDSAAFHAFLNQEGYNKNGNIGSLRDYYLYSSGGRFNPHFDVYPVQINAALTSFGTGDSFSEGRFMAEGVKVLTQRPDFLANADKYCSSGKSVDGFIFLFPGMEEDALKQSRNFWGHAYQMMYNGSGSGYEAYKSNGYSFDKYLFIAQYADGSSNSQINQMGIFAHEFSHVLGLKDHYAKDDYGTMIVGPDKYDVMSQGMYNGTSWNAGNIPAAFSAFEREAMGWLTLSEISVEDSVYGLKKLVDMQAYSITNPKQSDEYYIVEYRPSEKYDAKLGNNGVFVWYIDYDRDLYEYENAINKDSDHQRIAVKSVLKAGAKFSDFSFVNGGGKAGISGIYSVALDGNARACFTPNASRSIGECPEESSSSVESSSSAGSSSSEALSSGAVSSSTVAIAGVAAADPRVRVSLSGNTLNVAAPDAGKKTVRLFDMQGNLLLVKSFAGTAFSAPLPRLVRGVYIVRVESDNRLLKTLRAVRR